MKFSLHDPHPPSNEYVSRMYFGPLRAYLTDWGFDVEMVQEPEDAKDGVLIMCGDYLSHERLERILGNGVKLCVFDINDSSYISQTYAASPLVPVIDLIFKVSGVPNRNLTLEPGIDENFNITTHEVKFLPDDEWAQFDAMRRAGRIKSLPYTLWHPLVQPDYPIRTEAQRTGKVLVGGGNHFWRVILFFKLVQQGLNDLASKFNTAAYFADDMVPQFRYCESCRTERKSIGRTPYDHSHAPSSCTSTAAWGNPDDIVGGPGTGKQQFGHWNNRCPASFFWLAKEYERHSGPLNDQIEKALNGNFLAEWDFVQDLSKASYYADYKWLSTIYLPPRFWEAASVGTPSFYPSRTTHQDYWPEVVEDEHYYTFPEDMSNFGLDAANLPPKHWEHVSRAVKALYEDKIRGTQYPISNALLEYMTLAIEEFCA